MGLTAAEMQGVLTTLGNPPDGPGGLISACSAGTPIAAGSANNQAPFVNFINGNCRTSGGGDSACNRFFPSGVPTSRFRRLCCCVNRPGQVENDPHVHTLKGAHYTLLKSGNFLAWSFSKGPVDWHLLAAYSGARLLAVLARLST